MQDTQTRRQQYDILRNQLELERTSFLAHWRMLSDYILPRRSRFTVTDTNKGDRRSQNIVDSTATTALKTLRSGMMSGITSPARPWFRLSTPDPGLAEYEPVKQWLYTVSQRMATVFLKSNLYNVLPIIYGDMGCFGTSCMFVEEDFDQVINFVPFPIGSYCLSQNEKLRVDTVHREFRYTVRQVVEKFATRPDRTIDWSIPSTYVKSSWDSGHKENWVDVCHLVKPNELYQPHSLDSKYAKYASCYYEKGASPTLGTGYRIDDDRLLREKGYAYFPALAPRWELTGEDVYATNCPGMEALGDIKQLQMGERRSMQAIEKMVNPPMVGPSSLKNGVANLLPGGTTYVDERDGMRGFRPAHEVNPRIQELEMKQEACRQRINRCFYSDIFLQITDMDRRQVTATEIQERKAEKLIVLGPVLEQLNQDALDPLIDLAFDFMSRQNMIPQPPDELQGQSLKVEYISITAQAQKLSGVENLERMAMFVQNASTTNPTIYDKYDMDQHVDVYSEMLSLPPGIVRSDEDVAKIRESRAQQEREQHQAEMAEKLSQTGKNLGQTPVGAEQPNAIDTLTGSFGGPQQ